MRISFFRHAPNTITCLNLFCGCLSIVSSTNGRLETAAYFILAAAVFDFLDGFAARWLKAYSAMGKELDSLADVVSFGVAPACIMYVLLLPAVAQHGLPVDIFTCGWLIATIAFLINKIRSENIPIVYHIELSNERIADTISRETGARKLMLHSMHNLSRRDFEAGLGYLDLMKNNLENLRIGLN